MPATPQPYAVPVSVLARLLEASAVVAVVIPAEVVRHEQPLVLLLDAEFVRSWREGRR